VLKDNSAVKPDLEKLRKQFSQNFEIKECIEKDLNPNKGMCGLQIALKGGRLHDDWTTPHSAGGEK